MKSAWVLSLFLIPGMTLVGRAFSISGQAQPSLPNLDNRTRKLTPSLTQQLALQHLQTLVPTAKVDFDPITSSPRNVSAFGFLTGPNGLGGAAPAVRGQAIVSTDPDHLLKLFLTEH